MRRSSTVAMIGMAGLLLAACGTGSGSPEVNVSTGENQTGITVTGSGEVTGTPDTVSVDIGVSVLADTVAEATSSAATKATAVIDALETGGVAEEDITTTNYSIYPEYDYSGNRQRLTGYRVTNTVRAKIRDVQGSGDVVDSAVAAGGDETVVNGLSFSIEDDTALVAAARRAAWDDAKAKATQLAELSGQSLGNALSINEVVTSTAPPIYYGDDAGAERALATPIQPGTSSVVITITVNFAIAS